MKRTFVLASFAATSLWSGTGPVHAAHVATGWTCGLSTDTDAQIESGHQTGQMQGGPIVATTPLATVQVRCEVHVGAVNSTHAGFAYAAAWWPAGSDVQTTALAPTYVSYLWLNNEPVYLCTRWTVDGTKYYYDAATATFATTPSVTCEQATVGPSAGGATHVVVQQSKDV